jgi:hypothetical protein
MSTNTPNLGLGMPDPLDFYDVAKRNDNWMIIDKAIGDLRAGQRFVLWINFDHVFQGRPFTVTGGGMTTFNGTVPATLSIGVPVPHANTTYTITCDSRTRTVATSNYFGLYFVRFDNISNVLAENSWADIADVAARGAAGAYWRIGDEITIQLTGTLAQPITLQIYGFNHDELTSGGKAGITFGMKNLMSHVHDMNPADTNANSFAGSELCGWLNLYVFDALPAGLRAVIKQTNKRTSVGEASSTIRTDLMSLFLFSEAECSFFTVYSYPGEGSRYPIFTDNASRVKRTQSGSSGVNWWFRSPAAFVVPPSNLHNFCRVTNDGALSHIGASHSQGVCFGFCV